MSSSDAPTPNDDAEAPEVETDELRESLLARVTELLGDAVVGHHIIPGKDLWIRVTADAWAQLAEEARFVLGARQFTFLSAIDWMPSPFGRNLDAEVDNVVHGRDVKEVAPMATGYAGGDTRFQVFARVTNIREHWGVTLKADCAGTDDAPSMPTWTKAYAGADWHEREAWEMFGIDFVGHPFLRHIYLPGEFEGNPMRKDFPLLARFVKPWPGIVDVEPFPPTGDEPAEDGDGAAATATEAAE